MITHETGVRKSDFFPDNKEPGGGDITDIQTVSELDAVEEKRRSFLKMPEETVDKPSSQSPPTKKAKKTLGSLTSMTKTKHSPSPAQSPRDHAASEIAQY